MGTSKLNCKYVYYTEQTTNAVIGRIHKTQHYKKFEVLLFKQTVTVLCDAML